MSDDWDPTKICHDENCDRPEVHRAHRLKIRVHHRPRADAPLSIDRETAIRDGLVAPTTPELIRECVLDAVPGELPTMMQWIQRDVRDDYGQVTDRTIYRHVRRLVQEAKLIKLDLGLAFAAYVRPKSRFLRDHEALRDFMLSNADCIPSCSKESVA